MSSSNQLTLYVFSDGKLIPIQEEMAQSQIGDNNNIRLFQSPPALIQVQSNNNEKQKSNNDTMDQVQEQSLQSLMHILDNDVDNDVENRHNYNSFLSELVLTAQNYPAVWDITA